MININNEKLLTLADAAKSLPGRLHVSTLWRWSRHGIRGTKLETAVIGGRRYTSAEALQRFANRLSAEKPNNGREPSDGRKKELDDVEKELDEEGL